MIVCVNVVVQKFYNNLLKTWELPRRLGVYDLLLDSIIIISIEMDYLKKLQVQLTPHIVRKHQTSKPLKRFINVDPDFQLTISETHPFQFQPYHTHINMHKLTQV